MMADLITNPLDRGLEVDRLRRSVPKGGQYAGWEQLDRIYTAKKGFPLVIYGAPTVPYTHLTLPTKREE